MANYVAITRSNYFRVKDAAAFQSWAKELDLTVWKAVDNKKQTAFAISADTGDCCGWPQYRYGDDEPEDIDFVGELAAHLDPRDVAVLLEIGSEKLRYLIGTAVAVDSSGKTVTCSLDDIYAKAVDAFGPTASISQAQY
jgi:hypothetical protein